MKTCSSCKWHDSFSCACCNGLSVKRGDFTDIDDWCDEWEALYDGCGEDATDDGSIRNGSERRDKDTA